MPPDKRARLRGGLWQAAAPYPFRERPVRQSARPAARAKNLTTLLSEALNEPVIVTENGGRRKITKRQAIITQLVNRSATAD